MAETAEITKKDLMRELLAQREEIQELRKEVRASKSRFSDELVRVQDFLDETGLASSTFYDTLARKGIRTRDKHGYPKQDGDKSAAYVSRTEWEAGEELDTRTVRGRAGFYD